MAADVGRVAVLGAGAMGTALALHLARGGVDTVLLATALDTTPLQAWHERRVHPTLKVPFHDLPCHPAQEWAALLPAARGVVVAVSSAGLAPVVAEAGRSADPRFWVVATKGWHPQTLLTPSQVVTAELGEAPVVSLAGPGLAVEIAAGAPTGLLCAGTDRTARRLAAAALSGPSMAVFTTSDVAGTETASAFKNVVAMAVGITEGLSARVTDSGVAVTYANGRASVFARGMLDLHELVVAQGGRPATVLGLAGAGDLYVTCQLGRNGRFGRLLGGGATVEGALAEIGSTVEGVPNTAAAVALAARAGIDLPTARIVQVALRDGLAGGHAPRRLRELFATALSIDEAVARPLP